MPCKIYLRKDQHSSQREKYSVEGRAAIFAPSWVKDALQILGQRLSGVTFEVYDNHVANANSGAVPCQAFLEAAATGLSPSEPIIETFTITEDFNNHSLKSLQKIARNEPANVTGRINKRLYPDIKEDALLYSIRDLVRQTIIVGIDESSKCGGYHCRHECQPQDIVYICDLAALQFQQPDNTGRLILLQKVELYKGILDEFIYENVMGEGKRSYKEVKDILKWKIKFSNEKEKEIIKKRYIKHKGFQESNPCFIDIEAYKKFVAMDVILSGIALSKVASIRKEKLHFKFLKYGTGFFAGVFQAELERHILAGVVDGLERLFSREDVRNTIKCVELPFFKSDWESDKRIKELKDTFEIDVIFSTNDALKQTQYLSCHEGEDKLRIATTNCGDNHAVCGNEMGFSSVDAAIAENLCSKGNLLCPNINLLITEEYLNIN